MVIDKEGLDAGCILNTKFEARNLLMSNVKVQMPIEGQIEHNVKCKNPNDEKCMEKWNGGKGLSMTNFKGQMPNKVQI